MLLKCFVIAEYDSNDKCVAVYESIADFSIRNNISYHSAFMQISRRKDKDVFIYNMYDFVNDDFYYEDLDSIDFALDESNLKI